MPAEQGNLPVCAEPGTQDFPRVVPDGAGGIFLFWFDTRSGTGADVYAQRLDASGRSLWAAGGIPVTSTGSVVARFREPIAAVPDGAGGAIVAWADTRIGGASGYDAYAQRLDAAGNALWLADGVPVLGAPPDSFGFPRNVFGPELVSDGAGGAVLLAWASEGPTHSMRAELRVQRISPAGAALWGPNGTLLAGDLDPAASSARQIAEGGGAIVSWDGRVPPSTLDTIYAQAVDGSGALLWGASGVTVCQAPMRQNRPDLVSDGVGGAILAWNDNRNSATTQLDIYAQRLTAGSRAARVAPDRALARVQRAGMHCSGGQE